jgi:hypothetical protein
LFRGDERGPRPGERLADIGTHVVLLDADLTQILAACGSFASGDAPARRWRDEPTLMQFLSSL